MTVPEEVMSILYPSPSARSWNPFCMVGQYAVYAREVNTYESTLKGSIMATQKRLFGEVHCNLFCNGGVCEEHELASDSSQPGPRIESGR